MAQVANKHWNKHGVLVKVPEVTYGTALTLAGATDGFLVPTPPVVAQEWIDDGTRDGRSAGGYANLARVDAAGLGYDLQLEHYFRGPGAAYTASVKSTLDAFFRMFGMSATLDATPGAEKITYALISDSYESGTLEVYRAKEKLALRGAVAYSLKVGDQGMGVPKWTIQAKGIGTLPTDAAVPAITYPNLSKATPKATKLGLTLTASGQTFTGRIRSHALEVTRAVEALTNQNDVNGDHGGFQLGMVTGAKLSLVVDATTLQGAPYIAAAAIDPYQLFKAGTSMALAYTYGATQYQKLQVTASNVQFASPPEMQGQDAASARWAIDLVIAPPDDASDVDLKFITL